MTLGFKQYFPWHTEKNPAPSYFREKILGGQRIPCPINGGNYASPDKLSEVKIFTPKIHTMREDPHNRWKAGRKIEMVYRGAGYKILDHFNKGIPELEVCTGVQEVKISHTGTNDPEAYWPKIEVDGRVLGMLKKPQWKTVNGVYGLYDTDKEEVVQFVKNDGFESITQFCRWFKKDWSGKILHWTDFRY